MPDQAHLTLADIARLAGGVTAPAVANWRNRFDDFPEPVAKQGRTPLFDRDEVIEWLTENNRLGADDALEQELWKVAEAIRASTLDFAQISEVLADPYGLEPEDPDLRTFNERYRALCAQFGEGDTLATAIQYGIGSPGREFAEFDTPPRLRQLVANLAATPPGGSVYDPCAGFGNLLLAAAAPDSDVYGQEINPAAAAIAQRLLTARGHNASIRAGDTIKADQHPTLTVDRVVAAPSGGLRIADDQVDPADPRWTIRTPKRNVDGAFVQIVLAHLNRNGRAIIHLPASALHSSISAAREHLVRNNLLDAVIMLPSGITFPTESCLLVIDKQRPESTPARQTPILLVNQFPNTGTRTRGDLPDTALDGITQLWEQWRHEPIDHPHARVITLTDIARNDFNLSPARYAAAIEWPRLRPLTDDLSPLVERIKQTARAIEAESQRLSLDHRPDGGRVQSLRELERDDQLIVRRGTARDKRSSDAITPATIAEQPPYHAVYTNRAHSVERQETSNTVLSGDVLVSLIGTTTGDRTRVMRVDPTIEDQQLEATPDVLILRCTNFDMPTILNPYLYFWLSSPLFQHHLAVHSAGSMIQRVSRRDLMSFELPIVDLGSQLHVCGVIEQVCDHGAATRAQLRESLEMLEQHQQLTLEHLAAQIIDSTR